MESTSRIIALILQKGKFGVIGEDIFVGHDVPQSPDKMFIIRDYASFRPDDPNLMYSYPMVQLVLRNKRGTYQYSFSLSQDVNQYLQHWRGRIDDTRVVLINNFSGPVSIGVDDDMRPIISTNFSIMKGYYKV